MTNKSSIPVVEHVRSNSNSNSNSNSPKRFIRITRGPNEREMDDAFRRRGSVEFFGKYSDFSEYCLRSDEDATFSGRILMFYPDAAFASKDIWSIPRKKFAISAEINGQVHQLTLNYNPRTGTGYVELPF